MRTAVTNDPQQRPGGTNQRTAAEKRPVTAHLRRVDGAWTAGACSAAAADRLGPSATAEGLADGDGDKSTQEYPLSTPWGSLPLPCLSRATLSTLEEYPSSTLKYPSSTPRVPLQYPRVPP